MSAHPLSGEWRPFHRSRTGLRRRRTARVATSPLPCGGRLKRKRSGNLVLWMAWRAEPVHDRIYDVCGWALTYDGAFRKARRALQVLPANSRPHEWNPSDLRIRRIDSVAVAA